MRTSSFLTAAGLLACLSVGWGGEAAPAASVLSRKDREALITRYCQASPTDRPSVLQALREGGDELQKKTEVATWAKTVQDKARKSGAKLLPKETDLLARLAGKQLEFNRRLGLVSAPVAALDTPVGQMRAIVLSAKEKNPAVVVYLHGGGNVGGDHPGNLDNEMAWGWGLLRTKTMTHTPFRLMPRCLDDEATNAWVKDEEARAVELLLDALLRSFDVNPDRIHLFGVSMGGFGAWNMGSLLADRFASVVDATGGMSRHGPMQNMRNVPFAVFIGQNDTSRAASAKKGVDELLALRAADAQGYEAVYREYPGMGHELQDQALADINSFFAEKVRASYPRTVVWNPSVPWKQRFYNLAVPSPASGMSIRAVMGEDNVVTITSSGVKTMDVFLNDSLVNLDKDVRVLWNGKEVWSGRLPRRVGVVVETLAERLDTGQYYCAKITLTAAN